MKYSFIALLALTACGDSYIPIAAVGSGPKPPLLTPCTVIQTTDGALITCTDGSQTLISNGTSVTGPQGPKGDRGDAGQNGLNGLSCTMTSTPTGALVTCPDSPPVAITNGSDGSNGADGTVITSVKFCTSDNSSFPEYGIKIGNDVYAVYWGTAPYSPSANTAFLTKLIPGTYTSTGGNGCTFVY